MMLELPNASSQRAFPSPLPSQNFVHTCVITHVGKTIAVALLANGRFVYNVLSLEATKPHLNDRDAWAFPSLQFLPLTGELRPAGADLVPPLIIPRRRRDASIIGRDDKDARQKGVEDPYWSSTESLTNASAPFTVIEDGRYIYLFRTSIPASNPHGPSTTIATANEPDKRPFVDGHILLDRFTLVDNVLSRRHETRYQRSGLKTPINNSSTDSLGAVDMLGVPFFEPTLRLDFIVPGPHANFSVIRVPTSVSNIYRWSFFTSDADTNGVVVTSVSSNADGLFDVLGSARYTCTNNAAHGNVYSLAPGRCQAVLDTLFLCGRALVPLAPEKELAAPCLSLDAGAGSYLDLTGLKTPKASGSDWTIEMWIAPFDKSAVPDFVVPPSTQPMDEKPPAPVTSPAAAGPATYQKGAFSDPNQFNRAHDDDEDNGENSGNLLGLKKPKKPTVHRSPGPSTTPDSSTNRPSPPMNMCILAGSSLNAPGLSLRPDGKLVLRLGHLNGTYQAPIQTVASLSMGKWNHLALVRDNLNRTFSLVVNGRLDTTVREVVDIGSLESLGKSFPHRGLRGLNANLMELRVWKTVLSEATIMKRMQSPCDGTSRQLAACFRFDDGRGLDCHSITGDVVVTVKSEANASLSTDADLKITCWGWATAILDTPASATASHTVRLVKNKTTIDHSKGFGACLYYEQVATASNATEPTKSLKRAGRILLTFAVFTPDHTTPRLGILDLGLTANGDVVAIPGYIQLPPLVSTATPAASSLTPSLIAVSPLGVATVGAYLDMDYLEMQGPATAMESAVGKVHIFFRGRNGQATSMLWDVLKVSPPTQYGFLSANSELGAMPRMFIAAKDPKIKDLEILVKQTAIAGLEKWAVDVTLTASLADGSKTVEMWNGVPKDLARFVNAISGMACTSSNRQTIVQVQSSTTASISLSDPLDFDILASSSIVIQRKDGTDMGTARVAAPAAKGSRTILTLPFAHKIAPTLGDKLIIVEYDYSDTSTTTSSAVTNPLALSCGTGSLLASVLHIGQGTVLPGSARISLQEAGLPTIDLYQAQRSLSLDGKTYAALSKDARDSIVMNMLVSAGSGLTFEAWLSPQSLISTIGADGNFTSPGLYNVVSYREPRAAIGDMTVPQDIRLALEPFDSSLSDVGSFGGSAGTPILDHSDSTSYTGILFPEHCWSDDETNPGFTVELWIKRNSETPGDGDDEKLQPQDCLFLLPMTILGKGPLGFYCSARKNGGLRVWFSLSPWFERTALVDNAFDDQHRDWLHLALVVNKVKKGNPKVSLCDLKLYANGRDVWPGPFRVPFGIPVDRSATLVLQPSSPAAPSLIAGLPYLYFFIGGLRVWSEVRSVSDLQNYAQRRLQLGTSTTANLELEVRDDFADHGPHHWPMKVEHAMLPDERKRMTGPFPPLPRYRIKGLVNGRKFATRPAWSIPHGRFCHVAVATTPAFGLTFSKQGSEPTFIDCGSGFDLSDFSIQLSILVHGISSNDYVIATSAAENPFANDKAKVPWHLSIRDKTRLELLWIDVDGKRSTCAVDVAALVGVPTCITVSRQQRSVHVEDGKPPSQVQTVSFTIVQYGVSTKSVQDASSGTAVSMSSERLRIGGAPWEGENLRGVISNVRIYRTALDEHTESSGDSPAAGCIAWYKFSEPLLNPEDGGNLGPVIKDTQGQHDALISGSGYSWSTAAVDTDSALNLYVDGQAVDTIPEKDDVGLKEDAFTDKNQVCIVLGADPAGGERYSGEIAEARLWRMHRSAEQITDCLFTNLVDVDEELIAYYPMNDQSDYGLDHSYSAFNLSVDNDATALCAAPISFDAPMFDRPFLMSQFSGEKAINSSSLTAAIQGSIGCAEYGDVETLADGTTTVGSFKRAYASISADGTSLILTTGFRIGATIMEFVSQIQTAPSLEGYIEGPPPVPAENYYDKVLREAHPVSSTRLIESRKTTLTYNSRTEGGWNTQAMFDAALGVAWDTRVSVFGLENTMTRGHFKWHVKGNIDVSGSQISNESVSKSTVDTTEVRAETSGQWTDNNTFNFNNVGIALVTSCTADVYAMRLKLRDRSPLIAYTIKPSDLPADRNIITFPINATYTKQGCLDGRCGLKADTDYVKTVGREQSYYKPTEAYALKKQVEERRQALQAEFDTYQAGALNKLVSFKDTFDQNFSAGNAKGDYNINDSEGKYEVAKKYLTGLLPSRTSRSLANEYVWSAQGGFYALSQEGIEVHNVEVGSSLSYRGAIGLGTDIDATLVPVTTSLTADLLMGLHFNMTSTKDKIDETTIQVLCDVPAAMDLRVRASDGTLSHRQLQEGAVDTYRWMTFYLEPDAENTRVFFNKVVDPIWLQSDDPSARALKSCVDKDAGRSWRVMHRVTYVSRILPNIASTQEQGTAQSQTRDDQQPGPEISANYQMLRTLEMYIGNAKTKAEITQGVKRGLILEYPSIALKESLIQAVVELMAQYLGF